MRKRQIDDMLSIDRLRKFIYVTETLPIQASDGTESHNKHAALPRKRTPLAVRATKGDHPSKVRDGRIIRWAAKSENFKTLNIEPTSVVVQVSRTPA
jgi:hypothetical protein